MRRGSQGSDEVDQPGHVEPLLHGAAAERFGDLPPRNGPRGKHHRHCRQRPALRAQGSYQPPTVRVRHHEVDQDERRRGLLRQLDGAVRLAAGDDGVARHLQEIGKDGAAILIVLDDKDAGPVGHRSDKVAHTRRAGHRDRYRLVSNDSMARARSRNPPAATAWTGSPAARAASAQVSPMQATRLAAASEAASVPNSAAKPRAALPLANAIASIRPARRSAAAAGSAAVTGTVRYSGTALRRAPSRAKPSTSAGFPSSALGTRTSLPRTSPPKDATIASAPTASGGARAERPRLRSFRAVDAPAARIDVPASAAAGSRPASRSSRTKRSAACAEAMATKSGRAPARRRASSASRGVRSVGGAKAMQGRRTGSAPSSRSRSSSVGGSSAGRVTRTRHKFIVWARAAPRPGRAMLRGAGPHRREAAPPRRMRRAPRGRFRFLPRV